MAIASAAGKRVQVVDFGKSWEGRPLRIYIVSSLQNMARLPAIQANSERRAHGDSIAKNDPVFVWVNECIYGDETASFESGMALLYNLAASRDESITRILDKAVVLINPCYNPDGSGREGPVTVPAPALIIDMAQPDRLEASPHQDPLLRTEHRMANRACTGWPRRRLVGEVRAFADQDSQPLVT